MRKGYTLAADARPSDWIRPGLRHTGRPSVLSRVPAGFAAYGRMLHPAERVWVADPDPVGDGPENQYDPPRQVPWREVAAANGRVAHRRMHWPSLITGWGDEETGQQFGLWDHEPAMGWLPRAVSVPLSELLACYTSTPGECFFAIWEGWSSTAVPGRAPAFRLPGRDMRLVTGPVSSLSVPLEHDHLSPSLPWPADRAWCLATDVDDFCTHLAGSQACIDAVVGAATFEAYAMNPDDALADTVNPAPPDW